MFTEQLPDLLDYVNNPPGFVCLVGDMNIHFDNPLQSLTKQTLTILNLYSLVQVVNKPTHRCGHIIDWVIVRPDDDIHKNILLHTLLNNFYVLFLRRAHSSFNKKNNSDGVNIELGKNQQIKSTVHDAN